MSSPLRLRHPRGNRPHLVVLQGGRASAPAPFVVAPPAVLRLTPSDRSPGSGATGEAQVRADEADLIRCRRLVSSWR